MKTWHQKHKDGLTTGERAADVLRNAMGSWPFVLAFLAFMGVWAFLQGIGVWTFDPYPYILLNLCLSMLAGLQGAILLIAAKRMDAISAALAQHDYETNLKAAEQIEALTETVEALTGMVKELLEMVKGKP